MSLVIKTFSSETMGIAVNCYLLQTSNDFFLIDTGLAKKRDKLVIDLDAAGCRPGNLMMIILTHGDLDHSGNSAFLCERYGTKIAVQQDDLVNVQSGDMFANKKVNPLAKTIARLLFFVIGLGTFDTFTPEIYLEDMQDLSLFGLDAIILHLPGHSRGSIGILTADGDLFCGDLLENTKIPSVNALGDDTSQMKASAERLSNKNDLPRAWQAFFNGSARIWISGSINDNRD